MALEIVELLLGPVLEISKCVAAPIKRQLNYLCCFTANITGLANAEVDEGSVNALEGRVQSERNNLQVISHGVEKCLNDIKEIEEEKRKIVEVEAPNVKKSGCFKVGARYSVSKRAKETTDRMKKLEVECREFNKAPVISRRGDIAAVQETPMGTYHKFKSREDIEALIMTKLRDGNVNMIGIWGMGGLGKTTMAKNIMNRVRKEGVFQEVVLAEVGEEVDELNLQVEIGGQLGLELREENRVARVQKLDNRLSEPRKKTLLVLDNVWQKLKLKDIGIPCASKWCTILITSRNEDDLSGIECSDKAIIKMEQLSDDEARSLFKETAGSCVDRDELKPLAEEVVKECGGLPISLTTVGFALRDENDASRWETAVRRLKEDYPDIPDYKREVYNPLKLSYDALGLEELKFIFLLCCLFPENVDIPLEYLTYLCIGLGILKGSQDLEVVKSDVSTGTKALKSRSLLLVSNKRDHVRIHDVVRYVGISVAESMAGNKRHMDPSGCTWRFSHERDGERSRRLFLIRNSMEKELKFENVFSDGGITDLYVLWIANHSLTSLPQYSKQSLANLNTLILDSCRGLVEIPIVGALVELEILICRHCGSIEELPPGIKGLKCLKLLEFTGCGSLKRLRSDIISSLDSLEKLKMLGSFKKWEAKDGPRKGNARLRELENLTKLTCLEIEIEDPALAAEDMQLSSKVKRFDIRIGVVSGLPPPFISHPSDTKLSLCAESQTRFGYWITTQLLKDTICLYLHGNGANNVDFTNCEKLCWLELGGCETMKNTERTMVEEIPFHRHKVSALPFSRLQEIKISEYADTMSLFTSSIAKELVELRVLSVSHCDDMVKVIEGDDQVASGGKRTLLLPDLEELELFSLRKLVSFCEWESDVEFPSLRQVVIMLCPKMEKFTSRSLLSKNLQIVKVNYEDIGATEDLNGALQQYLARGKEPFNSHEFRSRRDIEENNPELFEKVYNPIKLSYDSLGSMQAKSLFLLCCLFPEDSDIPLEYLTYFCMGLDIFEGIRYVEEAWDTVLTLTQMLIRRSLLLDSNKRDHVRMHSVVHCVCILIAKEEGYIGGEDCTWISSLELRKGMKFPNLRLIFLSRNYISVEEEVELNNDFLEGIRNLHVLFLRNYSLTSLPHSTQPLANFKTLVMDSCRRLMSISIVGELVNLEILICRNCDSIEELPLEIKGLYRLKLLDLTNCANLQRIGRGIISSLICLEELKMLGSFKKWEAEDKEERENAMLSELEALTNLRCLEIQVEDPALVEENIRLSSKVKIFDIRIGAVSGLLPPFISHPSNRKLSLCVEGQTRLGYWIEKQLLRGTNCLYLCGNGANNLNSAESRDIRWLELGGCKTMEDTVTTSTEENPLHHHQISTSVFYCLEKLSFSGYDNTMSLFTSSIAGNFANLRILKIHHCDKMVRVIEDGEEMVSGGEKTLFPKLKELKLKDLPKLAILCEWKCDIVLPSLRKVVIKRCPYMKNFSLGLLSAPNLETFTTHLNNNLEVGGNVSFDNMKKLLIVENENPFDCHKICISLFSGLVELRVSGYHGSRNLFTSSIPKSLATLRVLTIENCDKMEKAIGNDEEEVVCGGEMTRPIFLNLEELRLEYLREMVSFCEWKCNVEFPSLRIVVINRCPRMKSFSLGVLFAPNLETFTTDLNNNLELGVEVSFNSLKELLIMENKIPFYQHKIHESLFNRLEDLRVSRYHGSMGLFTYSILQKLTSLTVLTIENCDEMVKAIEDEEEVVSGGEMTRLFPKLKELRLDYLQKMVSFCEWKCGVELPSLRKVFIRSCPHMTHFTSGYLYTPALGTVIVDDEDIGGTINLNYKLHLHLARAKGQEVEKRGNEIGN